MEDIEQYQDSTVLNRNILSCIDYIRSGYKEEAWRLIQFGNYSFFKNHQWKNISVEQKKSFFEMLEVLIAQKSKNISDKTEMLNCCKYACQLAQTLQLPEVEKKFQNFYINFIYHCEGAVYALLESQSIGLPVNQIEQIYYNEIHKSAKRMSKALQSASAVDICLLEKILSENNRTVKAYIEKKDFESGRTFYRLHLLPLLKYKGYFNKISEEIIAGMKLLHNQAQNYIQENFPNELKRDDKCLYKFANDQLDQLCREIQKIKDINLSGDKICGLRLDYEKILLPMLRHPAIQPTSLKIKIEETFNQLNQMEIDFYSSFIADYRIQDDRYLKNEQKISEALKKARETKSDAPIEEAYIGAAKFCADLLLHYEFDEALNLYEMLYTSLINYPKLCQKIDKEVSVIHDQKIHFMKSFSQRSVDMDKQQNLPKIYQSKIKKARNLKMPVYIKGDEEFLLLSLGTANKEQKSFFYQEMNSLQKRFTKNMNKMVKEIFQDCLNYLGQPPFPCAFTLLALGSMGNHTMALYSDLEAALLIEHEHPDNREYFKSLMNLLQFKLFLIGEGVPEKEGFYADSGMYPEAGSLDNEHLCATPEKMAGYYKTKMNPNSCMTTEFATSLLGTDIIYASSKIYRSSGKTLYKELFRLVDEHQVMSFEWAIPNCLIAQARALEGLLEIFNHHIDIFEKSNAVNVKSLLRLLENTLVYLCHYKGIYVRTPEDALKMAGNIFSPEFLIDIQGAIAVLVTIRYRHHLNHGYRQKEEEIFQSKHENNPQNAYILNPRELANIRYIQLHIIEPLQHYLVDLPQLSVEKQYPRLNKKIAEMKNWQPASDLLNEKLIEVTRKGLNNKIKELLEMGADIQIRTNTRKTLLHVAAEENHLETVKFLLQLELACFSDEGQGLPLMHIAVKNKSLELLNLLIEQQVPVNTKNANGETALHKAVILDDRKIINYLLQNGANPNVADGNGNTTLHFALKINNPETIKSLIEHGAYYKARNSEGKRPIDMASNQETQFFLERQHRALKQVSIGQLKLRVAYLEEKVKAFEKSGAKEAKNDHTETISSFKS